MHFYHFLTATLTMIRKIANNAAAQSDTYAF